MKEFPVGLSPNVFLFMDKKKGVVVFSLCQVQDKNKEPIVRDIKVLRFEFSFIYYIFVFADGWKFTWSTWSGVCCSFKREGNFLVVLIP